MSSPYVKLAWQKEHCKRSNRLFASTFQRKRSPYVTFHFNNSCGQLAAFGHPNGQGNQANLGTICWTGGVLALISERFRDFAKTWSLGFRLDSGEARIQAKPASQNPGGAPSRLAWVHSPGLELSAGG